MLRASLSTIGLIAFGCLWLFAVISASQKAADGPVADQELIAYAREVLGSLQSQSFEQNREFCGAIYRDGNKALNHTDVAKGEQESCEFDYPENWTHIPRASFHTHGAFDPETDSEVPSVMDLDGDIQDKVLGFISTPGGRMWMVDWDTESASLVCGEGCLPMDPKYRKCGDDPVKESYTIEELSNRFDDVPPDLVC